MKIKIEYSGAYPNLCSGLLVVDIDGERFAFPPYCLSSGGGVWFDDEWSEHVDEGEWTVTGWPEEFPEALKGVVTKAVNEQIDSGCCGGCV